MKLVFIASYSQHACLSDILQHFIVRVYLKFYNLLCFSQKIKCNKIATLESEERVRTRYRHGARS